MKRRDLLRAGLMATTAMISVPLMPLAYAAPAGFYDLEFPALDGRSVAVSDFLGKPMVLNFWATWCPPCVKEMPDLDFLQNRHHHVSVVGLAVDSAVNVQEFSQKVSVSYPLLVAGHSGIQLMKKMGNPRGALPFTILFDAAGRPVSHFLGQIQRDELDDVLSGIKPS